jgi:hypothetical protein
MTKNWRWLSLALMALLVVACAGEGASPSIPEATIPAADSGGIEPSAPRTLQVEIEQEAHQGARPTLRAPVLTTPILENMVESTRRKVVNVCPKVDSVLNGLLAAEDATSYAGRNGIRLTSDGVLVMILLVAAESELPGVPMTVRNHFGPNVEAYVPLEEICKLAAQDGVLTVSRLIFLGSP